MITTRILAQGIEEIIEKENLETILASGKKLRVKFGIDPTAPDLHLGHMVPLRKLRQFQDAGHQAVLIIGDFTALIGDPSGRSETRPPLTKKEIQMNEKRYLTQAGKVIDIAHCEIRHNSEWLNTSVSQMLELQKAVTVQQLLHRADFKKRMANEEDISVLEMLYPLLQGYDSVAVKADVEIGGTDQKFNLLMGRRVQRHFGMPEQNVIMTPLIEGIDGVRKMSKSLNNAIGIDEAPNEMFGKLMAIPDALMPKYFTLLTDREMPMDRAPRDAKMILARTITALYHDTESAEKAEKYFIDVFSKKQAPDAMPELKIENEKTKVIDLIIAAGGKSKSEARRLIEQGGVKINNEIKKDPEEMVTIMSGVVLHIGKRQFFKLGLRK